ncbi:MAG: c-type cytochrome domain-containing protein, partial [Planctomycetota bacterium]
MSTMDLQSILPRAMTLFLASVATATAADPPLLERDVLPILTKHCMGCHGGLRKFGGLDLRTLPTMLAGGESGPAITSGSVDASHLWKRIVTDEMPEGENREKLSAADKSTLRAWIEAGLPTVAQRNTEVA